MVMNSEQRDFEELVIRYLDNALDQRALAEFSALLAAKPELRALFNDMCLQTLAISERFQALQASRPARPRLFSRRRLLVGSAVAAGVLVAAGLKMRQWWPFAGPAGSGDADTTVGQLEEVGGEVCVAERPLAEHQSLGVGQTISTVGVSSSARIRCADGTYLVLGENTSAVVLDSKLEKIRLDAGSLAVDAQRRPESRPLHIVTSDRSEVLASGAKLWLENTGAQVRVVHRPEPAGKGAVELRRLSDGQSVPIQPGQCAIVDPQGPMRPEALPPTPDTWLVEFDQQLPAGWEIGQLVFDDLPQGSKAAVRAMPFPHPKNGQTWYKVQSHKDWTHGLFAIHDDSCLHVRFRVDKPGFFHCLVVARDPDATRRISVVLEANDFWRQRQARRWYTAHIPFSDFKPTRPDVQIDKPLIAFLVLFDCQGVDRGLAIDRLWITRGPDVS
jgi:ferric-dicitrate binding protein FerR (iron transport regulator)